MGFHGGQAGLGNRGFLVTLTDVSGASCRLDGYPGLELRDASWRPLFTRTRRGPTYFSPRAQGEHSVRSEMVTGIARSSARTASLYSEPMSVST